MNTEEHLPSNRSKTHRRPYEILDVSGAVALGFYERNFQTLSNDAENSLKRPWHKLERGLRIGRIRDFVSKETERITLNEEDSDALFKLLVKALDRKLLNSKAAVTYDSATHSITEIKGLVSHTSANNRTKYQILEKKPAATLKKRAPSAPPLAPSALSKELPTNTSSEGKNEC
jgi:hypothetical protein